MSVIHNMNPIVMVLHISRSNFPSSQHSHIHLDAHLDGKGLYNHTRASDTHQCHEDNIFLLCLCCFYHGAFYLGGAGELKLFFFYIYEELVS